MAYSEQIISIKDPRIVEARALGTAAGRESLRKCLLEGAESLQWAIEAGWLVEHVFMSARQDNHGLKTLLAERHIPCYTTSDGILKKISDTTYLVPHLGVAHIPEASPTEIHRGNFVVMLDHVLDHGNVGTIIRTASAFGIRDLVSTTATLDLYYKKIITASRGRVFDIRLQRYASGQKAVVALQQQGYQVIATSPYASTLQSQVPLQAKPIALVVGNETEGISDEIIRSADIVVQIPMSGLVESLNVGVATGISLYELKFRMVLTMLTRFIRARLGREINVTSQRIQQAFDIQLKQVTDLTGTQVILLMILKCDQTMSLEQVSKDTTTFSAERVALLKPLFEKGYISYLDATEQSILLTEQGEQAIAQLWNTVERAEQEVLAGFSEQEKAQLDNFLKRIQDNCMHIRDRQPMREKL